MSENAHGNVIAQIQAKVIDWFSLTEQPRTTCLVIPERPTQLPEGIQAIQDILSAVGGTDFQRFVSLSYPWLISNGTNHEFIDAETIGIIG